MFTFDLKTAARQIASELQLAERSVIAAAELLDQGNTIPFIARYRKEATGGIDEIALRAIEDALEKIKTLLQRKGTVWKTIEEQGALTDSLRQQIIDCQDLATLELIYLPYKPKRRTRATIAREQGLAPLAELLMQQKNLGEPRTKILNRYVSKEKGVNNTDEALQGALDIIAEVWGDDVEIRTWMMDQSFKFGKITSQVKRGKKEEAANYEQYLDRTESVSRIPGYRVLAMLRGSTEGVLRVALNFEGTHELNEWKRRRVHNRQFEFYSDLIRAAEDCYERILLPATETAVLQKLKERADEEAIAMFGKNLRELLMAPPAGPKVTMGIDPGFRTGCKVVVLDSTGKLLANTTIYPTAPKNDISGAGKTISDLIERYRVELIAIGNGTASRETDAFVSDLIQKQSLQATKVVVSESGASIYSASEIAAQEFPDLDLTVRGAISIGRRLQDPLAELVKIDAKSIGVGQYQHDVNQPLLKKCLDRTVESCVNQVGVDLNMASPSLLSYVAGIGPKLAENIVKYREQKGRFDNRNQLLEVPKLGKKVFEQAAGFLRIRSGDQPLDNSAVHPESYEVVGKMARKLSLSVGSLIGNESLVRQIQPADFVDAQFGMPTISDIVSELSKPGRDPRSEFRVVRFDSAIQKIEDLRPNLVLEGVITNVTQFGAFVDIGVHHDALIHISQLSNEFVKDPSEVVSAGDIVKVKVLEVDLPRKRISVTRKL
ncbi:MAG: Tex family protein [Pirellula sp.]